MALYRCYLLDKDEHIIAPSTFIEAATDEAAIEQAGILGTGDPRCSNIEVWLGERRVTLIAKAA